MQRTGDGAATEAVEAAAADWALGEAVAEDWVPGAAALAAFPSSAPEKMAAAVVAVAACAMPGVVLLLLMWAVCLLSCSWGRCSEMRRPGAAHPRSRGRHPGH